MSRWTRAALALALLAAAAPLSGQSQGVTVRSDPRVELLAIVFRLAGNPEYAGSRVPAYDSAINAHFAPYREHAAVQEAKRLRSQYGVSFDAVMNMAVHIDDAETPSPRRAFASPDRSLEGRWRPAEATSFTQQLAAFARDARFSEFMSANRALFDTAQLRMRRVVLVHMDVDWLTRFFGRKPNGEFIMVPLLTIGNGNFGVRYLDGPGEEVYAVIATSADSTGHPAFDARFMPTMVHEFSHSFVNPAVDPVAAQFQAAGERIYPKVANEMRAQAYGNWQTMLNESLVRASVARYVRAHTGETAAQAEVAAQRARGFLWTGELYELLGEYEAKRAEYPTLDSFLPRVSEWFGSVAGRIDTMVATFDAARPKLVETSPAADAVGVDPALTRITLRFDKPMTPGININVGTLGRDHFPEVTGTQWNADGTELTLLVKLRPQWSYQLVLGGGFRSRDGAPLRSTPVGFSTR